MKISLLVAGLAIFALSGCGPAPDAGSSNKSEPKGAAPSAAIGSGTPESPREVRIEAGDAIKFSVMRLEAAPGETLKITLANTGSTPKEAMGHNWVLLRPRVDPANYAAAAAGAGASDYVPAARASDVIAHTKLLGGGQKDVVTFTIPAEVASGTELVFLCTFPAHFQLGMRGVLTVR